MRQVHGAGCPLWNEMKRKEDEKRKKKSHTSPTLLTTLQLWKRKENGYEFQWFGHVDIDLKVVNDNVLILKNMNDNDDNYVYDDIGEEDETLDDYANEGEK